MIYPPPLAPQPYPSPAPAVGGQDPSQPIIFFDSASNPGPIISGEHPRLRPHLVVEAFPTTPGTATVQIVDGAGPGSLTACTDSNGARNSISSYTKFMVKGLMERVAVKLTVMSGSWSVWGTWIDQASDRANYYDRNMAAKALQYSQGGVLPHTVTVRWSYTVPTARRFIVGNVFAKLARDSIATTSQLAQCFTQYIPASTGVATLLNYAAVYTNNVGDRDAMVSASGLPMIAGDIINLTTSDASTGGSINYQTGMQGSEFDL